MSGAWDLLAFAGVMVLGQFSPGPDMLLLTRTALKEGSSAGLRMAAGIASGLACHSTVAVAGVAVAYQTIPMLRWSLQWLAAIYLLWLAWGLVREVFTKHDPILKTRSEPADGGRSPFVRGLLCNLLNPKAALFLAAVSSPFLTGDRPDWWPAAIWLIVVGLGLVLWSLWVLLLQWKPLRVRYERCAVWIDGLFGLVLIVLAIRLMIGW